MVQRLTWLKVADSSQAQWLKTFHLYGGFSRRVARLGTLVKGAVRVIQAIPDPYKGFTVRRINKGRVLRGVVIRHAYQFMWLSGNVLRAKTNDTVILKEDSSVLIKHVIGPCFRGVRRKQILALFRTVL
uniref:ribosomal protein L14 n=1 Tax=Euplotes cristatus TaxID=756077 RepID=UPI002E787F34|nr:ribosomal protein L14 [Euplotes cristatus]UPM52057.1 ribosomal protein L14 [Euplotes cristatus]